MLQSHCDLHGCVVFRMRYAVPCSALPQAIFYGMIFRSEYTVMQLHPRKYPTGNVPVSDLTGFAKCPAL